MWSGSRTPARYPTRPPSILAAAVAGNGVPVVARLKATHGVRNPATGTPRQRAASRERAGQPEERHQQHGFGARESSEPEHDATRPGAAPRVQHEGGRHQQRGQRDFHAGERAPYHRPGHRHQHGGKEGDVVTPGPDQGEAAGQPRSPERGGDPQHLGQDGVAAEHRERPAEREGPERCGRARHRHARVVGEPAPLGQIARELHVDPRVVEREGLQTKHARDLARLQQEESDRERECDGGGGAAASARPLTGRRARRCSRRTRRACG